MKKNHLKLIVPMLLLIVSSACNSLEKSDKTADKFYENMKAKDYEAILELVSEDAFKANPREEWITVLKAREKFGKLESHSRIAFEVKNNITRFDYKVKWGDKTYYDRLVFVEEDGEAKIIEYQYNVDQAALK